MSSRIEVRTRPRHGRWAPVALAPLLLFASIQFGARLPGGATGGAGFGPLDLSRGPSGSFAPLREGYLAGVLGGSARVPAAATHRTHGRPAPPIIASRQPVEHPPTNDDFEKAYPVPDVPFTARTSSEKTSRQAGEPGGCAPIGNTVWYRFRPAADIGLIANTFGTDRATTLGVFTGADLARLEQADCARHPRGNAHVPIAAKAGVTYHFQVASVADGVLVFDLRPQGVTTRFAPDEDALVTFGYVTPGGRYVSYSVSPGRSPEAGEQCVLCSVGQALVYDRATGKSAVVSVSSDGDEADGPTLAGSVSSDGRFVLLGSIATNLDPRDTNTCRAFRIPGSCPDLFVHDRDADQDGVLDETHPGARKTVLVSVSSDGEQGNDWSWAGYLSSDGRYITFQSDASNLVPGDTNGIGDVFVHDRDADGDGVFDETHAGGRRTWRVSVSSSGAQAEDPLLRADPSPLAQRVATAADRSDYFPAELGNHLIGTSLNGRYLTFRSRATNLVPGDTNGLYDVFLHDLVTAETTRINVSSNGRQADRGTRLPNSVYGKISDDGRYAIFNSDATNLVPGDANDAEDLFLRDLVEETTERITVRADGTEPAGETPANGQDILIGGVVTAVAAAGFNVYTLSELNHTMTADGRFIVFSSGAALVDEDENGQRDIYIRDRLRGTTSLLSVSTSGTQGNQSSNIAHISADGRVATFMSGSTNLAAGRPDELPASQVYQTFLRVLPTVP